MNPLQAGQLIKRIREEKGITLRQVSKETKIHMGILERLESGNVEGLGKVHLRGFLRIYSRYLELDEDYVLEEFGCKSTSDLENKEHIQPISEQEESLDLLVKLDKLTSQRNREKYLLKAKHMFADLIVYIRKRKRVIFVSIIPLLILFLLIAGIRGCVRSYKARRINIKTPVVEKKVPSKPVAKNVKAEDYRSEPIAKSQTSPLKASKEGMVRIGIKTTGECWVQVKIDGDVVFSDVLKQGKISFWEGKRLDLWVGNAGNVILQVGDKEFSPLGRNGQVLKGIIITSDMVKIGE